MLSNLTPPADDLPAPPATDSARVVAPGHDQMAAVAALVTGDAPADVTRLLQYLKERGVDPRHGRLVLDGDGRPVFAALPVPLAGGVTLLLCPDAATLASDADVAAAVAQVLSAAAEADPRLELVQALRPVHDDPIYPALVEVGFSPLIELDYLARRVQKPPRESETRPPDGLRTLSYSPETHDLFLRALEQSYAGSLDCPEMQAMRTAEQSLAGHAAAGEFRPDWWDVLLDAAGKPLGVGLVAAAPGGGGVELVYLGVSADARGKGYGGLLLRRALATAAGAAGRTITLAVDARNAPALRLYDRHNFRQVDCRRVLLYRVPGRHVP